MTRTEPTDADRAEALTTLLAGLARGDDIIELTESMDHLHPKKNTFPGEVFMALGADALTVAGTSVENPIRFEDLARTHLPECQLRRAEANKFRTAVLFSASLSAGLEPEMFDDVAWWTTDDYWRYATWATIALIRACADHQHIPVTDLVQQLAQRHNIELP